MTAFVIDCSTAMAWCFKDEANEATDALLHRLAAHGGHAPQLWYWEVCNVLNAAVRRKRFSAANVAVRLQLLSALPVVRDAEGAGKAWGETLLLAQAERLSVYDAAYLELALRLGVPLATLDAELKDAAVRRGVEVLP